LLLESTTVGVDGAVPAPLAQVNPATTKSPSVGLFGRFIVKLVELALLLLPVVAWEWAKATKNSLLHKSYYLS
jgi:hypothetical protein